MLLVLPYGIEGLDVVIADLRATPFQAVGARM
jgi:hypothetical protein